MTEIYSAWIPVTDRFPDDIEDKLLWSETKKVFLVGFWRESAKAWDNCNTGWVYCGISDSGELGEPEISHWMPLPEPPKEVV
jgi:hypothetical protein